MVSSIPVPCSTRSRRFWGLALVATLYLYSGSYWYTIRNPERLGDFFQEWASAKSYFSGLPIYTPQETTAWLFLKQRPDLSQQVFVRVNGHPPTCVLFALPFALLDYAWALHLWNVLSIAAVFASAALLLRLETGRYGSWLWLPLGTLLLSNPLGQHVIMGQLGAFLLLFITGSVVADARRRPVAAGLLLGTATALKLFPGLLFLYFVIHRQWRAVAAGAVAVAAWNLAALGLFGVDAYADFVRESLPEVLRYRNWWGNYSLTGFWYKLFTGGAQSVPLVNSPTIAQWGAWLTQAAAVGGAAYVLFHGRNCRAARRSGFALLQTVMILAAPIAWDHYFVLLLWPLLRLAIRAPQQRAWRRPLYAALFFIWLNPLVLLTFAAFHHFPLWPGDVLAIVNWPFYAVLTTGILGARLALGEARAPASATADRTVCAGELQPAAAG